MQDFVDRGGKIEYRRIKDDKTAGLGARFDLLVVSSGRDVLGQLFAYRPEHTPFTEPQRRLFVGLYHGIKHPDPMNVTLSVSPGHGEMIVLPTWTFGGLATALLMENIPGGDRGADDAELRKGSQALSANGTGEARKASSVNI